MTLVREKNTTYSFILLLNNVCLDFIYFCEMWFSSVLRYSLPPLCVRLVGYYLFLLTTLQIYGRQPDHRLLRWYAQHYHLAHAHRVWQTTARPQAPAIVRTALPSVACKRIVGKVSMECPLKVLARVHNMVALRFIVIQLSRPLRSIIMMMTSIILFTNNHL